jgi:hypothetical protein
VPSKEGGSEASRSANRLVVQHCLRRGTAFNSIEVQPEDAVAEYKPERHRTRCCSKAEPLKSLHDDRGQGQARPGPPACTAVSAKHASSDTAGAPSQKDSTNSGTKGRAEET